MNSTREFNVSFRPSRHGNLQHDAQGQNVESGQPPNRLYQDLCFKAFYFSTAHLIQCLSDFRDLFGRLTLAYLVVAVAELYLQELASNFFTLGL